MKLLNLTWKEFSDLDRNKVVIIPVGSLEQHGLHLPLGNDTIVADTLATKVAEKINALQMPGINYGYTYTFSNFSGTIGISHETLINMVIDIGSNIVKEGFEKIVFLNAHDENHECLIIAAKQIGKQFNITPLVIEWSQIAKSELRQIKESKFEMHGGEALTSLFLHWNPDAVRSKEIVDDFPEFIKEVEDNLYRQENKAHLVRRIDPSEIPSGTCGAPSKASATKGKLIEEAVVGNICNLIRNLGW